MSGKEDLAVITVILFVVTAGFAASAPYTNGEVTGGKVFIAKTNVMNPLDTDGDRIDDSITAGSGYPVSCLVRIRSLDNMDRARRDLRPMASLTGEELQLIPVIFAEFSDFRSVKEASCLPYVDLIELNRELSAAQNISIPSLKAAPSELYSPNTAYDLGITGSGVVIAVIDGGVDNEHPTFEGAFAAGVDFTLQDTPLTPRDGSLDPDDTNGHGTGVASVALGRGDGNGSFMGVAPSAGLIDLRIRRNGPTLAGPMSQAVEWCIENKDTDWGNGYTGVDIISISAGLGEEGSIVPQLITTAVSEGLTVISAATNSGTSFEDSPNAADYWADDSIIIGGTDDKDTIDRSDDEHWPQSTWGPRTDDGDDDPYDELKPDVVAPAYNIVFAADSKTSDINPASGWNIGSGTSYATPAASGIAALILEANPDLRPTSDWNPIREIFHETAEARGDVYDPDLSDKYNIYFGYGILDAYEAVMLASDFEEENNPPRITRFDIDPPVTSPGSVCTIIGEAVDPDGDLLELALTGSGGEIGGGPGEWTWTAPEDTGFYTLTFRAEDPEGLFDEETADIEVIDIIVNHPPRIESVETTCSRIPVGESCTLEVTARDKDGDELDYIYDPSEGYIEGVGSEVIYHAPDFPVTVMITVTVRDPYGAEDSDFIQITVYEDVVNPPLIHMVNLVPASVEVRDEDAEILLMAEVTDSDGEVERVYADLFDIGGDTEQVLLDDGFSPDEIRNDNIYTYKLTMIHLLDPGTYDIPIYAVDEDGQRAGPATIQLEITEETADDDADDGSDIIPGEKDADDRFEVNWQILSVFGLVVLAALIFVIVYIMIRKRRKV
ncbi:MAG: S8 family serine peptidase [Thermoplasmatota archaeon]